MRLGPLRVEFLWFDGCPNHRQARTLLDEVLREHGLDPAETVESVRVDGRSVARHRFPGSPTIRVNGIDIEPGFRDTGAYAMSCRVPGVPERRWVEAAISRALRQDR